MDPHNSYEYIITKHADAWLGIFVRNRSLATELQNLFSLLVMDLKKHNHQQVLTELRNIFSEWEWEGENGGFKKEVSFPDAAGRLYRWLDNKRSKENLLVTKMEKSEKDAVLTIADLSPEGRKKVSTRLGVLDSELITQFNNMSLTINNINTNNTNVHINKRDKSELDFDFAEEELKLIKIANKIRLGDGSAEAKGTIMEKSLKRTLAKFLKPHLNKQAKDASNVLCALKKHITNAEGSSKNQDVVILKKETEQDVNTMTQVPGNIVCASIQSKLTLNGETNVIDAIENLQTAKKFANVDTYLFCFTRGDKAFTTADRVREQWISNMDGVDGCFFLGRPKSVNEGLHGEGLVVLNGKSQIVKDLGYNCGYLYYKPTDQASGDVLRLLLYGCVLSLEKLDVNLSALKVVLQSQIKSQITEKKCLVEERNHLAKVKSIPYTRVALNDQL